MRAAEICGEDQVTSLINSLGHFSATRPLSKGAPGGVEYLTALGVCLS
jgi:hypothetical protein